MRKAFLLAALAVPASAAAASAQAFGAYDWTGPYLGVNLGYADGDFDMDGVLDVDEDSDFFPGALAGESFPLARGFSGDDTVIGLQGGYNVQMGSIVVGLEGDFQFSGISGSTVLPNEPGGEDDNPNGAARLEFDMNYYGTLRGRAGWTWDRFLIYATAGGAIGKVTVDRDFQVGNETLLAGASNTRYGWTAGGGVELAVGEWWTVRAEYLRVDLGSDDFNTSYEDGSAGRARIDTKFDTVRMGVNLRF